MLYDSTEHIPSDPGEGLRQARLDMAHPAPVQVTKWQRRAARWQKRLHKVTRLFKADETSNTAPAQASPPPLHHLHAKGVVYASILNPSDARKNWCDIVTGFVSAFQNVEDAVLVLKLNELDSTNTFIHMTFMLKKFMWMKCKIYIFNGYLEDHDYDQFLDGIDYVVNFSTGEGQCLPLMELMSMGVPAISPDHTSMADYVTPENAYILPSFKTLSSWPHDSRLAFSTLSCQVSWEALRNAYTESYQRAKLHPSAYQVMSRAAMQGLAQHCSLKVATSTLAQVLTSPAVTSPAA
jgi:glycosyltransferase involved in cell wall biosynthesis